MSLGEIDSAHLKRIDRLTRGVRLLANIEPMNSRCYVRTKRCSAKHRKVYEFMVDTKKQSGRLPTRNEIREYMGWRTNTSVWDAWHTLAALGVVKLWREGGRITPELV